MTGAVTRAAPGRSTAIASDFRADQALPYIGAAGFAISAVLTRLPLAGKYLFDWDSVQFALGMSRFDLAAHRPHPPGYLGYIVLGKAVAALFDLDANRALALLSIGAEALTVAGIFLLARRLFGGFAGMAAALLLLTSPLYWLYGETALTYGLEPGLALLGFWLVYRSVQASGRGLAGAAFVIGLEGAIRPSTEVFLLPLLAVGIWLTGRDEAGTTRRNSIARDTLRGIWALAAGTALWLLPLLALSGGPIVYVRDALQLGARVSSTSAIWRAGAGALTLNSKAILDGVGLSLGIYLPLMLGILFVYRVLDRSRDGQRPARSRHLEILFVAWTVPALLTFVLIHIGELAYVLYFLPAMLLPAGLVLDKAAQALTARRSSLQVPARSILLCACAAANIGTFALPSGSLLDQLRNRDTHVSALLAAVHRFSPASTVLITDPEGPSSYRTAMYYLSNYAVIAVGRDRSGHAGEMFSNRPGAPAYDLSRFERAGPLRLPSGMRALILDRAVLHSIADPWTLHAIRPSGDRRTLIYIVSLDPSDPPLALGRWIYVRASDADPYPWIDATQRRGGTALAASGYVEPTAL